MSPLEEARNNVSKILRDIIRVEVINRFQEKDIGLQDIDESLDEKSENTFAKIMSHIEESFDGTRVEDQEENEYRQAHLYYASFTIVIVGYMIGFNIIQ